MDFILWTIVKLTFQIKTFTFLFFFCFEINTTDNKQLGLELTIIPRAPVGHLHKKSFLGASVVILSSRNQQGLSVLQRKMAIFLENFAVVVAWYGVCSYPRHRGFVTPVPIFQSCAYRSKQNVYVSDLPVNCLLPALFLC